MIQYGYFDSQITGVDAENMPIFDRAMSSALLRRFGDAILSSGVVANPADACKVIPPDDGRLRVRIRPGVAFLQGAFAVLDAEEIVDITPATTYERYDRIILRLSSIGREIIAQDLMGAEGSINPGPPDLMRPAWGQGDYYDIALATVHVIPGVGTIRAEDITDTRSDDAVCGFVHIVDAIGSVGNAIKDLQARVTTAETELGEIHDAISPLRINSAANHRIYRGRRIGSRLHGSQSDTIRAGDFGNIYVGDYWDINGSIWRVVDLDYFYGTGDTALNVHHAVIMPDVTLYYAVADAGGTTAAGYAGMDLRTSALDKALTTIKGAFGAEHILRHKEMLSNAATGGRASAWSWYSSEIEVPSEPQIWGGNIWGGPYDAGVGATQFAAFAQNRALARSAGWYWLRGIADASKMAASHFKGYADALPASTSAGIRPYFLIY